MFKKILVPLDTSRLSEIALPYAEELAVKLNSEVILLHVGTLADSVDRSDHAVYLRNVTARTERKINRSPALPPGRKVKVTSALLGSPAIITNPPEEILDYAEKEKVSLLVMATHGRTGLRRWALGSTANKIAKAARCPLLFVRAGAPVRRKVSLDKIMVPLDGSLPGEVVLPYIEALALKLKSQVILFSVVEPLYHVFPYAEGAGYYGAAGVFRVAYTAKEMKPAKDVAEKYLVNINDKLASRGIAASYRIKMGSPSEEIIKAADKLHVDLVAMSMLGQSGFGRFDSGSVADKVLHKGNKPLLLIRPRQP